MALECRQLEETFLHAYVDGEFAGDENAEVKAHLEGLGYTDVSDRKDRGYFESVYVRTAGGALFEAKVSKKEGFTIDEPPDSLGVALHLPPFLEGRRAAIAAALAKPGST